MTKDKNDHVEKAKHEYDLDEEGIVGKAFKIEGDIESQLLCSMKVNGFERVDDGGVRINFVLETSVLQKIFRDNVDIEQEISNNNFYIFFEADKDCIKDEIVSVIKEKHKPVVFGLGENEDLTPEDKISVLPKIRKAKSRRKRKKGDSDE